MMAKIAQRLNVMVKEPFRIRAEAAEIATRIFHDWEDWASDTTVFEFEDGSALRFVGEIATVGLYIVGDEKGDKDVFLTYEPSFSGASDDEPQYMARGFDDKGRDYQVVWFPDDDWADDGAQNDGDLTSFIVSMVAVPASN